MDRQNSPHQALDRYARRCIRRKAWELVHKPGFSFQDLADLEQELTQRLLLRWRSYNPRRGPRHPFVFVVVKRAAAHLLRERRASKRRSGRVAHLHDDYQGHDGRRSGRSAEVLSRMRLDVQDVIGQLPPHLQALALLLKEHSLAQAARMLGLPRSSIYPMVAHLRRRFLRSDLQNYLQK